MKSTKVIQNFYLFPFPMFLRPLYFSPHKWLNTGSYQTWTGSKFYVCCILNTWNHYQFFIIFHPNIDFMRKLLCRNLSLQTTKIHFPPIWNLLTNTGQLVIGQVISPFEPIVKPIHQYKKVLNCTLDARFIGNLGHLINVKYCLKIYSAWHMIIFSPILS